MNLKITDIKYRFLSLLTACAMLMPLASCKDDPIYDPSVIGDGDAAVSMKLNFYEISNPLNSRATEGGTPGDAIGEIESLCVLVYDMSGNLFRKYTQSDLEGYSYTPATNSSTSADAVKPGQHQAEAKTGQAKFTIGVENRANMMPFGRYRIYAVANMGGLEGYDIDTEDQLHKIRLKWNSDDISKNNQMFGYFTTEQGSEASSEGFTGDVIINQNAVTLHSWMKRMVSKVTVAFDGTKLKENIWIFLKSVTIKDIPDSCYLGADYPVEAEKVPLEGVEIPFAKTEQTITYAPADSTIYTTETWPAYISRGHAIYGADEKAAVDPSLDIEKRLAAQHSESINSLFLFENMQGKGVEGTESDKRQQVNQAAKDTVGTSFPEGIHTDNKAWKDAKKYGSYIEVKAYYYSINPGDPGQGEITYRFMLGKDTHLDYNTQRNHHYKLTLRFNGYANDVDWHIDYKKEDRKIQTPNPYYISYLYNHSMMLPLDIDAGTATISKIEAEISSNNWAPMGAENGVAATPGNDAYALYWNKMDNPTAYPWNGFLSLQKTVETVITAEKPFTVTSNQAYYNQSPARNKRVYTNLSPSTISKEEALVNGEAHVALKNEDNNNHYTVNIPLWTRAKQLIKETAYTGNNPFAAYQREAKIKVKVVLSDSTILTTGLSTNNGAQSGEEISIRQVRRIVNPKGIWRSGKNNDPFHVVLKILPNEESVEFKPLASEGPWRAFIIRDTKRGEDNKTGWNDRNGTISLEGHQETMTTGSIEFKDKNNITRTYQTIEGETGSNMDFTINFNGTTDDANPNYAIIRVEYHNYTCVHLIYVRQGYGADDIAGDGVKWMTSNNVAKDSVASSPLDEGSMFKFGNWDQPIASSNNVNNKSPWTEVKPNDFIKNAADDKELTLATSGTAKWDNITSKVTGTWAGPNQVSFDSQSTMRVARQSDYANLYSGRNSDMEQGYGVLYGDGSNETLSKISDVYGYMSGDKNKGMRGCFVYNYKTGKNLFFPIGASGYGHRINSINNHKGLLRYNCSTDRWGYFNTDRLPIRTDRPATYPNGVNDCPLFFDVFRRPGAIYWFESPTNVSLNSEGGAIVGWDINYFTFDFFQISGGNVAQGKDACFVRSIQN